MNPTEIAIAVMSCHAHRNTRQVACRDTWFKDAARLKVRTFFVEGHLDPSNYLSKVFNEHAVPWLSQNRLNLPCFDGYYDLRHKIKMLMQWFTGVNNMENLFFPHYLYKCDDDTFVHVDRLLALEPGKFDYIGCRINEGFAAGGAGYIVSRKAAKIVADCMTPKNPVQYSQGHWGCNEDYAVGELMKWMGIELWDNRRFNHGNDGTPTPYNDSISGHHIQPDHMRRVWAEFQPAEQVVLVDPPPSPFLPECGITPARPYSVQFSPGHPSPCQTQQDSSPAEPR